MYKHKKLFFGLLGLLCFVALMHFVAIYNRTGSLDMGMGNVCIGYGDPVPAYYRIIPNGIQGFNDDKKYFKPTDSEPTCAKPVTLRLYLW